MTLVTFDFVVSTFLARLLCLSVITTTIWLAPLLSASVPIFPYRRISKSKARKRPKKRLFLVMYVALHAEASVTYRSADVVGHGGKYRSFLVAAYVRSLLKWAAKGK